LGQSLFRDKKEVTMDHGIQTRKETDKIEKDIQKIEKEIPSIKSVLDAF
jgi:pyridoxine 5'-phosphate synthase PdxJ